MMFVSLVQIPNPSLVGVKEGDKLSVKVLGFDHQGRFVISRKALLPPPANRPRATRYHSAATQTLTSNQSHPVQENAQVPNNDPHSSNKE